MRNNMTVRNRWPGKHNLSSDPSGGISFVWCYRATVRLNQLHMPSVAIQASFNAEDPTMSDNPNQQIEKKTIAAYRRSIFNIHNNGSTALNVFVCLTRAFISSSVKARPWLWKSQTTIIMIIIIISIIREKKKTNCFDPWLRRLSKICLKANLGTLQLRTESEKNTKNSKIFKRVVSLSFPIRRSYLSFDLFLFVSILCWISRQKSLNRRTNTFMIFHFYFHCKSLQKHWAK